ncbi:Prefoldin, subunit 4 [Acaromyces ingoldii]|uniref:Prefoldin subunit 4 n=1 Tax=Acaromyces ingoldii TaxID=215250 RepID=A0A316YZD4_9BASI|nr:Prefoldin, subunit 4 [Acaromyces ingoldii]PWN94134.1 Prefoldin, subunit 4 [Acaromyces ingoldii]
MRMLEDDESNNDVEVSWADQQSINSFSRLNNLLTDAEATLRAKVTEKEGLDEIAEEIELVDEEEEVMYRVGDAFVYVKQERAIEMLKRDGEKLEEEIEKLRKQASECEEGMEKLKVGLYAKFGSNINLERD